jgi:hypothetical protein
VLGDSIAWGGCTIIYLLGQQLHFELSDFSYQALNVAEVEASLITQTHRIPNFVQVNIFSFCSYCCTSSHSRQLELEVCVAKIFIETLFYCYIDVSVWVSDFKTCNLKTRFLKM